MSHPQDNAEWLRAKLISVLGRMITVEEMRDALGLKQSTYYDQVKEDRLISLDNLKAAARSLNINEVYLLVECGLLDRQAAEDYAAYQQGSGAVKTNTSVRRTLSPLSEAPPA